MGRPAFSRGVTPGDLDTEDLAIPHQGYAPKAQKYQHKTRHKILLPQEERAQHLARFWRQNTDRDRPTRTSRVAHTHTPDNIAQHTAHQSKKRSEHWDSQCQGGPRGAGRAQVPPPPRSGGVTFCHPAWTHHHNRIRWGIVLRPQPPHTRLNYELKYERTADFPLFLCDVGHILSDFCS